MKRLFIILSVLVLAGCIRDDIPVGPDMPAGRRFTITLVSGGEAEERAYVNTRSETPGVTELNENLIQRVEVFFFDTAGQCLVHPTPSDMTLSNNKIAITMSEDDALKLFNREFRLYLVANSELPRNSFAGKAYDEVAALVQTNAATLNPDPFIAQGSFLMDGAITVTGLTDSRTDLGKVVLRRAASKVVVSIVDASVSGYIPVAAHARMNNYLDKSVTGEEAPIYRPAVADFNHSGWHELYIPNNGGTPFEAAPFYSYSNDWEFEPCRESYVTVRVRWRKQADGTEKEYYYRIPFNYIPPEHPDGFHFRLRRNYIYQFNVNISTLGGLDPEAMVDLNPNFELRDWTTRRIEADLNQYDYLVVSERSCEIHDVNRKIFHYTSSKPIEIINCTAYYNTYDSQNGAVYRNDYIQGQANFPQFAIDTDASNITMTSPVPINYVPVYIEFTVRNTAGLTHKVNVVQYPRIYITSEYSDIGDIDFAWYNRVGRGSFWYNNGGGRTSPMMKNFNLYTVTTKSTAPGDNFVIGGELTAPYYNLTEQATFIMTKKDAVSNEMISPKFVIASQRGITSANTAYQTAEVRCALYMEGPYGRGTWRMPTLAEMRLISKLQRDPNSAIKNLFTVGSGPNSDTWWVSRMEEFTNPKKAHYYSVRVPTGEEVLDVWTSGMTPTNSIRCVHDVWQDN